MALVAAVVRDRYAWLAAVTEARGGLMQTIQVEWMVSARAGCTARCIARRDSRQLHAHALLAEANIWRAKLPFLKGRNGYLAAS